MKIALSIATAVTLALALQLAGPQDATAGTKVPVNQWPKWYYYDQLGLREWHKGEKQRALDYFDQSFKLAEAHVKTTKNFTPAQRAMVSEVINHQQFHMTMWRAPSPNSARNRAPSELMANYGQLSESDRERNIRWLDRIEAFARRVLGPNHIEVQHLDHYRLSNGWGNYQGSRMEADAVRNTEGGQGSQGKYTHAPVKKPKWYGNNERDFTPEMFTRAPRKAGEVLSEEKGHKDVSKMPTEKLSPGYEYDGGRIVQTDKVTNRRDGDKIWGGESDVAAARQDIRDDQRRGSGWGNTGTGQGQKMTGVTKWGIADEEQTRGGSKLSRNSWGQGGQETELKDQDKTWGGSSGIGGSDPNTK